MKSGECLTVRADLLSANKEIDNNKANISTNGTDEGGLFKFNSTEVEKDGTKVNVSLENDIAINSNGILDQRYIFLRAIDEQYNIDQAPVIHNKWTAARSINWHFDCRSVNALTRIPNHVVINERTGTMEWYQLNRNQLCTVTRLMIDEALREWLDAVSQKIGHNQVKNSVALNVASILKIAYTPYHHSNSYGRCTFDHRNVLAHANGDFVHINGEVRWCILGSKSPRYMLMKKMNGVVKLITSSIPTSYGQRLANFVNNGNGCLNLYSVLLHELGHSIGLGHSNLKTSLMYPISLYALNYVHASDSTFRSQLFLS